MRLPPDIWLKTLSHDAALENRGLALLSEEERRRLDTYRHPTRRSSFILGRAAARLLAADRLGLPARDVRLSIADDGAVDIVDAPLHLSISHSGDRALVALGERRVGADLERWRRLDPRLLDRILTPREQAHVHRTQLPPDLAAMLYWTVKEAVLKGLRTGLRRPLRSLEVELHADENRATISAEGACGWAAAYARRDGYMLCVAYEAH